MAFNKSSRAPNINRIDWRRMYHNEGSFSFVAIRFTTQALLSPPRRVLNALDALDDTAKSLINISRPRDRGVVNALTVVKINTSRDFVFGMY